MRVIKLKAIIAYYNKTKLLRWLWWLTVILPGIGFVLVTIGFLIYAHWPRDYTDISTININENSEYITLSAHGVKDDKTSWSDKLKSVMASTQLPQLSALKQQHISLNWQPHSNNVFTCSVAGKSLGEEIGNVLAAKANIKGIHLIGHSCGSFVILGICQQIKSSNKAIKVQTTYLDPVSVYSGLFWQYGIENFGTCADFSDTYIDTGDTVPGSNQLMPHSFTFDVTPLRVKDKIEIVPHAWPTHFYIDAYQQQSVPVLFNSAERLGQKYSHEKLYLWPFEIGK